MKRNGCMQSDFSIACAACTHGAFSPGPFHGCVIPWGLEGTSEVPGKRIIAAPHKFALHAGHLPRLLFVFSFFVFEM